MLVTFDVMYQIECFGYGFKAEHYRILGIQLTLKKIKLLELYKQIEFRYKIYNIYCTLLITTLYLLLKHFTSYTKGKTEQTKPKDIKIKRIYEY